MTMFYLGLTFTFDMVICKKSFNFSSTPGNRQSHFPYIYLSYICYFVERTVPPPPRDMFLNILTNGSLVIKWLPPPEEYRVRVRHYQLQVAEDDGKTLFFRFNKDITSHVIKVIGKI